jgi:hypothetical protein
MFNILTAPSTTSTLQYTLPFFLEVMSLQTDISGVSNAGYLKFIIFSDSTATF